MDELDQQTRIEDEGAAPVAGGEDAPLIEEDLLIEDLSIDGMCGVY